MTHPLPPVGPRRPNIAADIVRSRAAITAAGGNAATMCAAVCAHLEDAASRYRGGSVPSLPQLVCAALGRAGGDRAAARAAFVGAVEVGTLAEETSAAQLAGLDAERLVWALVGVEALGHLALVRHQANKLSRTLPGHDFEDLLGWGWQGLRVALRSYDPTRFAFSTYACTRIMGTMRDGVRAESPVPKRLTTELRKVARAEDALAQELERPPTLAEVHEALGIDKDRAAVLDRCRPAASIEALVASGGEDGTATPAWLGVPDTAAEAAEAVALAEAVAAALGTLDAEDAEAVRLLVLEDRSVPEVRELTGATARQLRQRRSRGLEALRGALADWSD